MTEFGLYVDRPSFVEDVVELLPKGHPIAELVVGAETLDGRRLVRTQPRAQRIRDEAGPRFKVRWQVWPTSKTSHTRYSHLRVGDCVADVERQNLSGEVNGASLYAGCTTVPMHRLVGSKLRHFGEREIQIYPIVKKSKQGHRYYGPAGTELGDPMYEWLSHAADRSNLAVSDLSVALPLWGLDVDRARSDLKGWVERCIDLEVRRVRFWSAKHLVPDEREGDLDDEVRRFILEDLPGIVQPEPASITGRVGTVEWAKRPAWYCEHMELEARVAALEEKCK